MSSVQTIEVHTAPAYEVTIGAGLLRECGARLKTVLGGCRIVVAADSNVAPLYLETVCASLRDAGFAVCSYVFPAGEAHKNFTTLSAILEFLAESQLTRTDCVAALGGGSTLVSTTRLESRDYVAMTRDALAWAGVRVDGEAERFAVPPSVYRSFDAAVEADWSQAGFWYAARFLGNRVELRGLNEASAQGDRVVAALYERFKAAGEQSVDVSDCPDLLPPLAVMAARRDGTTHFVNAARLRMKESDRLSTTAALLRALGVPVETTADSLTIRGVPSFSGGTVDGANDHRIVMAAAVAATAAAAPVTVTGAEAVRKSYPSFWEEYKRLGGSFDVL